LIIDLARRQSKSLLKIPTSSLHHKRKPD